MLHHFVREVPLHLASQFLLLQRKFVSDAKAAIGHIADEQYLGKVQSHLLLSSLTFEGELGRLRLVYVDLQTPQELQVHLRGRRTVCYGATSVW